jgi:hypothetical protein
VERQAEAYTTEGLQAKAVGEYVHDTLWDATMSLARRSQQLRNDTLQPAVLTLLESEPSPCTCW